MHDLEKYLSDTADVPWLWRVRTSKKIAQGRRSRAKRAIALRSGILFAFLQFMRMCIDLLESGIAFMHSKGIVHSDLKPSNLLFNESNTIQIADFGQLLLLQLHLSHFVEV